MEGAKKCVPLIPTYSFMFHLFENKTNSFSRNLIGYSKFVKKFQGDLLKLKLRDPQKLHTGRLKGMVK